MLQSVDRHLPSPQH